ncbi:MAG: endonuclease [Pseudonocardiales bacterium]|nr:endonuclease [Pseudonocardiales bacterium]
MPPNRRYSAELLAHAVAASFSFAGVLRHLGLRQAGGTQAHIARRIRQLGIDMSHFTGQAHARGSVSTRRLPADVVLVVRAEGSLRQKPPVLRRALIETGRAYICEQCGLDPREVPLTLQIDHINGDWLDNRAHNLRFLCPNCHALTPTYCVPRGAVAQRQRQTI